MLLSLLERIDITMKKIVIIGGAGFIGHNLAVALKRIGHEVSIIDSLAVNNLISIMGNYDNLPNAKLSNYIINERIKLINDNKINFFIQDARDYHLLSKTLNQISPNIIIHLAAVSHSNRSNKDPYSTFDHSLRTLENSLDNSKKKIEHFIYLSSSMVYGNFNNLKVNEETVCNPVGIYGALKFAGEKLVIAYNQVFDLPYTIIRPSALYGERCISRRVGQIFLEKAFLNEVLELEDNGSESLDFTYIEDLISGIINVIEKKNSINQIFNLTYGDARKIKTLIEILQEHFPNIKFTNKVRDKLMPVRGTLSIEKAKNLIEYNPKWNLEKGYAKYILWYKNLFSSFQ
jgi:nucleoside-diphosphate-sugar epimerase